MSRFEYVTVLMSFVVAFGVSELLAGWGRQYLHRGEARPFPLQMVASVLLLVALLQSVWGYWGFREVAWGFGGFLLALSPLLCLVGAAYLLFPPASSDVPAEQHYFSVSRAIFVLLAAWVALGTVAEWALVETSFHPGQVVRLVAVPMLIGLGFAERPALHWIGFAALAVLQAIFVGTVTPTLS